jgi:hypothetical protein
MRGEALIKKRFDELTQKAEVVAQSEHWSSGGRAINMESFHQWGTSSLSLIRRVFGKESIHYENFYNGYQQCRGYAYEFEECRGILKAAREDYEGGYLFDVRALVKADTLDDVLEQAENLKNANYIDGACILAGVALEIAVKEICEREGVPTGKFNTMNQELRKRGVYNIAKWRQLQAWYDKRSAPAHGNFGQTKPEEARRMIEGIRGFIADYLRPPSQVRI